MIRDVLALVKVVREVVEESRDIAEARSKLAERAKKGDLDETLARAARTKARVDRIFGK